MSQPSTGMSPRLLCFVGDSNEFSWRAGREPLASGGFPTPHLRRHLSSIVRWGASRASAAAGASSWCRCSRCPGGGGGAVDAKTSEPRILRQTCTSLGVHSFLVLFNHGMVLSQNQRFFWGPDGFLERRIPERMGKCPLELYCRL